LNFIGEFAGAFRKIEKGKMLLRAPGFVTDFERELQNEKNRIDKRTRGGSDKNGRAFKAYSKAYAIFRSAHGRGTTPNLEYTGDMLKALATKITSTARGSEGSIGISGDEAIKARRHIYGDGVPKRDFLGFTKEFYKNLKDIIRKNING
jgi:hypothetical protein